SSAPAASIARVTVGSFLNSDGAHRALLSFPTRRSSDLLGARDLCPRLPAPPSHAPASAHRAAPPALAGRGPRAAAKAPARLPDRSEEHTSELQSRRDVVCRLLREKKNLTSQDQTYPVS